MESMPARVLSRVPALKTALIRYGSADPAEAPFVVVGVIRAASIGTVGGVLAWAANEFHAHLLKRSFAEFARPEYGVGILRTASHPRGSTFDVAEWQARVRQLPAACRDGGVALLG